MPPKGSKRTSVAAAGGASKRAAVDPAVAKCAAIVAAIGTAETLPKSCQEMVASMAKSSLTIMAADRHAYQVKAVEMIGETLSMVDKRMSHAVTQAQTKVDNAETEKTSRAAAVDSAQATLGELEQKAAASKEAVEGAKAAFGTAKVAVSTAKSALSTKDAELVSLKEKKSRLETMLTDIYEPLKASKATGLQGRKNLNAMEKILTEIGLEEGLASSIHETFRKASEERGTYDKLVVKHLDAQTAQYIADAEKEIKAAEGNDPDTTVASAQTAVAEAEQTLRDRSAALVTAEAALKEGEKTLAAATKAVDNFDQEMVQAGDTLEEAKTDLTSFREGPLKFFAELKDLAPPPEPEQNAEVAAPPADAA